MELKLNSGSPIDIFSISEINSLNPHQMISQKRWKMNWKKLKQSTYQQTPKQMLCVLLMEILVCMWRIATPLATRPREHSKRSKLYKTNVPKKELLRNAKNSQKSLNPKPKPWKQSRRNSESSWPRSLTLIPIQYPTVIWLPLEPVDVEWPRVTKSVPNVKRNISICLEPKQECKKPVYPIYLIQPLLNSWKDNLKKD